ncbi:MAG: nucleotidyltransferase family protein [Bacteroidales bacterium]|nr:nucleotidyltransferase family protein [Bacteroidales bacterium]
MSWYASLNDCPEKDFLSLLRCALWGGEPLLSASPDWEAIYSLARRHSVQGTVSDIFPSIPKGQGPSHDIAGRWLLDVQSIIRSNENNLKTGEALGRMLSEAGIRAVMLKGQTIARMYSHPEKRVCGDIDWYIPEAYWEKTVDLFSSKGGKMQLDSDGDLHFRANGVVVELHRHWNGLSSPRGRKYLASSGIAEASDSASAALRFLLMQNVHILKHAMVKGIGLRQLCDLAMSYSQLAREGIFGTSFEALSSRLQEAVEALGLGKWTNLLHCFLISELGMPEAYLPWPCTADGHCPDFARMVMYDGNFGLGKSEESFGFGSRLMFNLRYAPIEYFWRISGLISGRLKRVLHPQSKGGAAR